MTTLGNFKSAALHDPSRYGPKLDHNNEPRFLEQVKLFFRDAASHTGIDNQYLEYIESCQSLVRFNIPLRRDDGSLEVISCYRSAQINLKSCFFSEILASIDQAN